MRQLALRCSGSRCWRSAIELRRSKAVVAAIAVLLLTQAAMRSGEQSQGCAHRNDVAQLRQPLSGAAALSRASAADTQLSALQKAMSSSTPCRGFSHMHTSGTCDRELAKCAPKSAYYWRGRALDASNCARLGDDVVCGSDVAVLLMTSNNTARRVAAAMASWVPAALEIGVSVIVGVASEDGAAAVRAVAPTAPIVVAHAKEAKTNSGSQHVIASLRRLHSMYPEKRWYAKIDDDAFLFPANLVYALAYHQVNGSEPVIIGNSLWEGLKMVSGGAGYVMSSVAMERVVAPEAKCGEAAPPEANEDSVVSGCVKAKDGSRFLHMPGFHMSQPDDAFTSWRKHHWVGESRYPITFHWVREPLYSFCLGCTCTEDA